MNPQTPDDSNAKTAYHSGEALPPVIGWASLEKDVARTLRKARRKWNVQIGTYYYYRDDELREEIAALVGIRKYIARRKKAKPNVPSSAATPGERSTDVR